MADGGQNNNTIQFSYKDHPEGPTKVCDVDVKTREGIVQGEVIRMEDPVIVLQRELGLKEDGMLGPKSSAAIEMAYGDVTDPAVLGQLPEHVQDAIESIQEGIGNGMFKQHEPITQADVSCGSEGPVEVTPEIPSGAVQEESSAGPANAPEELSDSALKRLDQLDESVQEGLEESLDAGLGQEDRGGFKLEIPRGPADEVAGGDTDYSSAIEGLTPLDEVPGGAGELKTLDEMPSQSGEMQKLPWIVKGADSISAEPLGRAPVDQCDITAEPLGRAEFPPHLKEAFANSDTVLSGSDPSLPADLQSAGFGVFAGLIQMAENVTGMDLNNDGMAGAAPSALDNNSFTV